MIYYTITESPLGQLLLTSNGSALTGLYTSAPRKSYSSGGAFSEWGVDEHHLKARPWLEDENAYPFGETRAQLKAYFEGRLTEFDVPLSMSGTDFQKLVWRALTKIPFGTTTSYGELARQLGNPNGSRAVGLANGRNPISIIVPCHRVIGSNGNLTGYGGGLPRKAALLDFEFAVRLNGPTRFPEMETRTEV